MSILITGFNGNVGFAVGHVLKNEKIPFYAGVQDPARIPENLKKDYTFRTLDYNEPATFSTALEGCNQLFLLYPPQVSLADFQRFIHFLAFSKIQHIVYLSVKDVQFLPFIPHYKNEALIRKTGIPYTFIRAGYFMQNLNLFMREEIQQNQQIFVPAGKGKSSFTDIPDIATITLHSLALPKQQRRKGMDRMVETDYAIRLLLYYGAEEAGSTHILTVSELARRWNVSSELLRNTVSILVENEIFQREDSLERPHLNLLLEQILLVDFIQIFETSNCFQADDNTLGPFFLKREEIFREAKKVYYATLNQYSFKELIISR